MLLEEFDADKTAVIEPKELIKKLDNFPEVTVACFSKELFESVLESFEAKPLIQLYSSIAVKNVYEIVYKGGERPRRREPGPQEHFREREA